MTTAPLSLAILLALMGAHSAMSQGAGAPQTPTPPAQAAAPAPRPTPPTRDPQHARLRHRQGAARRRRSARRCRRKLHHRPDAQPAPEMTVQDGVPQGTVFNFTMNSTDSKIYPGIARDAGHVRHGRSERPREARRDHQPSRALHAPRRGLRAQAIRPRHRRAVHRRRRWTRPAAVHGARQSDRPETRAGR